MSVTMKSIKGTVQIALEGHPASAVGEFEVPITVEFDAKTSTATLSAAPDAALRAAAAAALNRAADELLAGIPAAEVETA